MKISKQDQVAAKLCNAGYVGQERYARATTTYDPNVPSSAEPIRIIDFHNNNKQGTPTEVSLFVREDSVGLVMSTSVDLDCDVVGLAKELDAVLARYKNGGK